MAAAIAGDVLGPRPGRAICSFWQGGVEMVLRTIAPVVGSLPAFVGAVIAVVSLSTDSAILVPSDLETGMLGSGGYVIAFTSLAIVIELLLIIVRICNIGLVNLKVNIFLITDVILSCALVIGHLAGGIVTAYYASQGPDSLVRNALAASSAFSLLAVPLYACLAVWSIVFLRKEWNKKVVKYTLKEAISG